MRKGVTVPAASRTGLRAYPLRMIARYQQRMATHSIRSGCRFDPSCSQFAKEALETRSFPVAVSLILSRLARCNPMTRRFTHDPVRRSSRGPRPSAIRSLLAVGGLIVFLVGLIQSAAFGQVGGGCSASLNGLPLATLHRENPLVVQSGQTVTAQGFVPPSMAEGVDPNLIHSNFSMSVYLVEPWKISSGRQAAGIGKAWVREVDPSVYLKWGSGLYKVEATNFVTSPNGERLCVGTAYLRMKGGKALQAVGAGIGAAGLASGMRAKGSGGASASTGDLTGDLDELENFQEEMKNATAPPAEGGYETSVNRAYREGLRGILDWGCGFGFLLLPLLLVGMVGGGAPGSSADPEVVFSRIYRKKGHAILGAIGGLFFGIGLAVVIQQQGIWVLNIWNAIVLPVFTALFLGIRAHRGTPYRVTVRRRGQG